MALLGVRAIAFEQSRQMSAFKVLRASELHTSNVECLTVGTDGFTAVSLRYTGSSPVRPISLFNALIGVRTQHTIDELQNLTGDDDDTVAPITRTITEATVVLFDSSSSMLHPALSPPTAPGAAVALTPAMAAPTDARYVRRERVPHPYFDCCRPPLLPVVNVQLYGVAVPCSPDVLSRLTVAKQLLAAYTNRCTAYNIMCGVALLPFSSTIPSALEFTDNFYKFNRVVDDVVGSGGTRLYDAIIRAGQFRGSQFGALRTAMYVTSLAGDFCVSPMGVVAVAVRGLVKVKADYPSVEHLRIICLSDGVDDGSDNDPLTVARMLVRNGVVLDSFLLGSSRQGGGRGLVCLPLIDPALAVAGSALWQSKSVLFIFAQGSSSRMTCFYNLVCQATRTRTSRRCRRSPVAAPLCPQPSTRRSSCSRPKPSSPSWPAGSARLPTLPPPSPLRSLQSACSH